MLPTLPWKRYRYFNSFSFSFCTEMCPRAKDLVVRHAVNHLLNAATQDMRVQLEIGGYRGTLSKDTPWISLSREMELRLVFVAEPHARLGRRVKKNFLRYILNCRLNWAIIIMKGEAARAWRPTADWPEEPFTLALIHRGDGGIPGPCWFPHIACFPVCCSCHEVIRREWPCDMPPHEFYNENDRAK